jgi:hypothetical protein
MKSSRTSRDLVVLATVHGDPNFGPEGMNLFRLGGLRVGRTPEWFKKIVKQDFGGLFNADWYDHPATLGDSLVVQPYDLTHSALQDLIRFAEEQKLGVTISAMSHHYPTRTLAVFFTPNACGGR